jgi:dTDP-4-dehydrorhamnose reductase
MEFAGALWGASRTRISGVYHWANLGSTTWYDFAMECESLARELGLTGRADPRIVGVASDEFSSKAKRPRYSVLDPTRLAEALRITPSKWNDALRAELVRAS